MEKALAKRYYYAYILLCDDGSIYRGQTEDLWRRMSEHFSGSERCAKWTKAHKPVRILHVKVFETRKEAVIQEKRWQRNSRIKLWLRRRGLL